MRNVMKTTILENRFPLLSVEHGCIVSKDADITVAPEVELLEVYIVTVEEYENIHVAWCKVIKALPDHSVLHKQDWYVKEQYRPDLGREDMGFLARSYEIHFNERPFLHHKCYLFLTRTAKERPRQQSNQNTLCREHIVLKEVQDKETAVKFIEAVEQFARILNDSGHIKLCRLSDDELVGTDKETGIIGRYFALSLGNVDCLEDIEMTTREMRAGDSRLYLHTLPDMGDLPAAVAADCRHERLSADRLDCRLSFTAPLSLLLPCNHIYNQYVFIGNSDEELHRFEKAACSMQSLSRYSRQNAINREWVEEYLNGMHSQGLKSVCAHFSVMVWSDDTEELKHIKSDMGSQLAGMGCVPRHNTTDCPTLFWADIPGNAADFPAEELFHTLVGQAVCLFTGETNYKDSPSVFGIRMAGRISGEPLHIDISDLPVKRGMMTNRSKFALGPSGSGKSFFINHLVRQYFEQGFHVVLVDTGNSYQGLCEMVHRKTKGRDGTYFTYTEDKPILFNPFYTDDEVFDVEKKDSIKTLLLTLWRSENGPATKTESAEPGSAINAYILLLGQDKNIVPSFNSFYEYMRGAYRKEMEERYIKVARTDFNIDNFLTTLRQYYRGGRYNFLPNSTENIDLLHKRFVVFETDAMKGAPVKAT